MERDFLMINHHLYDNVLRNKKSDITYFNVLITSLRLLHRDQTFKISRRMFYYATSE